MVALQISPKIENLHGLARTSHKIRHSHRFVAVIIQIVAQNYKGLYGILQLLQGSHLDNFSLKSLKLGWVAFH